ncbi:PQQ-dependent dehydrogenase, methanol/ethanol family, partial [Gammaproteobacteria bacterium]|nr:PQQ-dependent dehydrogenase, methanol/ethanol family [Gammaproteobacteria bacterium]
VQQLGLSWFADYDTNLSQQGTPLYIDGVIYVSTAWSKVYAFDARNGEQLWQYDPETPKEWAVKVCCGIVNRGLAAFEGKIYLGTLDGFLVAIDASTGEELWRKLTIDQDEQYTITSAPRVIKGKILIGNSGSEFGVRGYVGAYDVNNGEEIWRFYTVPGNPELGFENPQMELAATTWSGEWWELGGGGTVWDAIVYDVENDLVFFGTGNGTPWNQRERDPAGGDNLFIASLVAVRPDTGEYVWHYQTTPGDTWDYDAMSPIMLLNLPFGGEERRVLVQANKNGFMYVLDAITGDLLKADPFTAVNWAEGVDLATGRPIENPAARYDSTGAFNLAPGVQGAHAWHTNAWNPETGLVYIAAQRAYFVMKGAEDFVPNPVGTNLGLDFGAINTFYTNNPDAPREFVGYVSAWDPVEGKEVWRSEEHDGPTGSLLATAGGLVFSGGGNNTNEFRAYDAVSGEKIWQMDTQTGVVAPPITYELDGKQYIAISVGINQAGNYYAPSYSRMLVLSLNGSAQLPQPVSFEAPQLNPPELTASAEEIAAGEQHYGQVCSICHGTNGQNRGANFPNLLVSPMLHSQVGFDQIVLDGVRTERGMVSFADRLQPEDSAAIRAYLIARATELKNAPPPAPVVEVVEDAHDDIMVEE